MTTGDERPDTVDLAPSRGRSVLIAVQDFPGVTDNHRIEVFAGRLFWGKLEAWVDGDYVTAAEVPNEFQPITTLNVGKVDGRDLRVSVDTPDGGATYRCHVMADGIPLSELSARVVLVDSRRRRACSCCLVAIAVLVALLFAAWLLLNWLVQQDPVLNPR